MKLPASHREKGFSVRAPVSTLLAVVCILAASIQGAHLMSFHPVGSAHLHQTWREACALSAPALQRGDWWRPLSYALVHGGFWHWALGVVGLYLVGRSVEPIIGGSHVALVVALGSIVGGLGHCLAGTLGLLSRGQMVVGTFPALLALLGVYSTVLPGWRVGGSLRWGRPWGGRCRCVPNLKAGALGWLAAGCTCVWWGAGWFPEAGPAAMLPALGVGWAYTRMLGFGDRFFYQTMIQEKDAMEKRLEHMNWEEFLNSQLNPVLEKISRHGLHSLTRAERRILRHSRRKLEGW